MALEQELVRLVEEFVGSGKTPRFVKLNLATLKLIQAEMRTGVRVVENPFMPPTQGPIYVRLDDRHYVTVRIDPRLADREIVVE